MIACIIGVIICFFKDCVPVPNVCITIAIIIPLLTLLIVRLLPIKDIDTSEEVPVSWYYVKTMIFIVVICLACLGICAFYFGSNITKELISTRVDSQNVSNVKA